MLQLGSYRHSLYGLEHLDPIKRLWKPRCIDGKYGVRDPIRDG